MTSRERILRWLLRSYPRAFREAYRDDLLEFFEEQHRDPRYRRTLGELRFWVDVVEDVLRNASRLRLDTDGPPASRKTTLRRGSTYSRFNSQKKADIMNDLGLDIRHSIRRLFKSPGFALAAIVTLGLGIGANTAIFGVVYGVVINPLPYPEADRLLTMWHTAPGADIARLGLSFGTYRHYKEHNRTFDEMAAYQTTTLNVTQGGEPQRAVAANVTASFFDIFQAPVLGRGISVEEDQPGGNAVVVMSDRLWRRRYGADPSILNRSILLDGRSYEVIGVMPPEFDFPTRDTDLWLAVQLDPARLSLGGFGPLGIGRLKPGVTVEEAQEDLKSLVPRLADRFPGRPFDMIVGHAGMSPRVTLLKEEVVGDVEVMLWILLGTVGLVLLVACANVANLFLVRAEGRRREVAVRMALGAGRGRMVRHFLTESLMLALVGGAVGLALAFAGVEAVVRYGPESLPRLHELAISLPVLAFTLGLSIIAGVGFGMIPVLRYAVPNLLGALKDSSSRGAVNGRERYRGLLVVSQVALALMLLVGAGLMVRSFWNLKNVDPGFIADGVLTFRISLPAIDYPDQETAARFQQQVIDRLEALPGVRSVGATTCLPLSGCRDVAHVMREGMDVAPDEVPPPAEVRGVTDGYFAAMGIPLLSGRTIDRSDHERRTRRVVVSQTLAEHFWPGESAIDKRIFPGVEQNPPWYTVAGVVSDVPTKSLMEEPTEILYLPMLGAYEAMHAPESLAFALKVGGPPEALAAVVREEIWAMDPNLPLASVRTMRSLVSEAEAPMAFTMVLLGIAGRWSR